MFIQPESEAYKQKVRDKLQAGSHQYSTGFLTANEIANKTFIGFLGPFGTGKTTITDEVALFKPTIAPINTRTTRLRKDEDPKGFKTASEGVTFASFENAYDKQILINYSVIPKGDIYGTLADGFTSRYNMGPLLPSSIEQLSRAGFKQLYSFYIVEPGDLWKSFVNKSRRDMPKERFKIRVNESIDSLNFALANSAILQFIENVEAVDKMRPGQQAAREVRNIVFKAADPSLADETAQQYLNEMLTVAKEFALE